MSASPVSATHHRHDRVAATSAWAGVGALVAFTAAAMASIGLFLLIPSALLVHVTQKRYGSLGRVSGFAVGAAVTVLALAVLVALRA
jgi:hypothetical protein